MKLKSADGYEIHIDKAHMQQHQTVLPLLEEVIPNLTIGEQKVLKTEIDMGRVVGVTDCVPTTQWDDIVFAQRVGRPGKTRFTTNRKQPECNHITVVIRRFGEKIKLLTAYIGRVAEREPFDPSIRSGAELMRSKHFWDNHALVWGSQEVVSEPD